MYRIWYLYATHSIPLAQRSSQRSGMDCTTWIATYSAVEKVKTTFQVTCLFSNRGLGTQVAKVTEYMLIIPISKTNDYCSTCFDMSS
jgi:hypothetical protein